MRALSTVWLVVAMSVAGGRAQCTKDIECKGDRICVEGECVSPEQRSEGDSEFGLIPSAFSLYFTPTGFAFFGPVVGAEIKVAPTTYLELHWRYSAMGLVYALLLTETFTNSMSLGSMAFGGGITHLFLRSTSPHAPFVGGFVEYGFAETWGEDGNRDWEGSESQIIVAGRGGFRWRLSSGLFLALGGALGGAFDIKDEWYYLDARSDTRDEGGTTGFGMVDFTLGWELGT